MNPSMKVSFCEAKFPKREGSHIEQGLFFWGSFVVVWVWVSPFRL